MTDTITDIDTTIDTRIGISSGTTKSTGKCTPESTGRSARMATAKRNRKRTANRKRNGTVNRECRGAARRKIKIIGTNSRTTPDPGAAVRKVITTSSGTSRDAEPFKRGEVGRLDAGTRLPRRESSSRRRRSR